MIRLEKISKKQLDDNQEGTDALIDKFESSFECYKAAEEKKISEANLNIQKILTDVITKDSDDVISEIFNNISTIDEANSTMETLERVKSYLFEEIQERKVVHGLKKKQ